MAVDELLLEGCSEFGAPLLRVYAWDRPAASIGYFQSYTASPFHQYTVVRRPTGGGTVFHEHDLTYSLIIPRTHELGRAHRCHAYRVISERIIDALQRLNIPCHLTATNVHRPSHQDAAVSRCFEAPAANDVMSGTEKIAGAAQKRNQSGLLHQGSINLGRSNPRDRAELETALLQSFQKNLGCPLAPYAPSPAFLRRANDVARAKYATVEWNQKR